MNEPTHEPQDPAPNQATEPSAPLEGPGTRVRGGVLLGTVALLVGVFVSPESFYPAYLLAYLFVLGLALGCLGLNLLHNLTGGAWGFPIKNALRAGSRTLWPLALLFVPIILGLHDLYEWTHEEVVAEDPILQHKQRYLNVPFFLGRAAFYFVVWLGILALSERMFARYTREWSKDSLRSLRHWSGPLLAFYCITMSFAAIDWAMSLEPHWFSHIYGVHFLVGQVLSTLCLVIVVMGVMVRHPRWRDQIRVAHFHDLGNLLMAFVMLWGYISFSQFLIIWQADLPEETPWYLHRTHHGWQVIALSLVIFHFAVPFLLLIWRRTKRSATMLPRLALALLVFRLVDLFWLIAPAHHPDGLAVSWLQLVAPPTLVGAWLLVFWRRLQKDPMVQRDGALPERFEEVSLA